MVYNWKINHGTFNELTPWLNNLWLIDEESKLINYLNTNYICLIDFSVSSILLCMNCMIRTTLMNGWKQCMKMDCMNYYSR